MIRLLMARTRIAFVAVAMGVSIPVITCAQTNVPATESEPVEGGNASPVQDTGGTDTDTSVETDPPTRSAISAEIEVEFQRLLNEHRRELLDDRAKLIDWWLAITAIFLTLLGIGAVIGGYLSFKRFREIEAEARQNVTASQQHTEESRGLVEEIKAKRHEADSLVEGINAQTVAENPAKANQAVANVQNNPDASFLNRAIATAVSLQQQDKRDNAIEQWRAIARVVEGSDNDQAARAWLSVAYLLEKKDPKGGMSAYGRAIRLNPDLAEAYNYRGVSKAALGQNDDAIADYDEAIRLKPGLAEAYTNRGVSKAALGQHDAAIADHDEAIRLKLDYADAYYNRGNSKAALGQHDAAIADYDEAIRLKPDYADAYTNRGATKAALGQHDAAIADYGEAIRLKPGLAEAHYNRGVAKTALGLKDEAREDFEIALELARNTNNAKIVTQAEKSLRDLDDAGDS